MSKKNPKEEDRTKEIIPPKKVAPLKYEEIPIRGLRYKNTDGTSRKEFLKSCHIFQRLLLIPEPSNPFDSNAIKVCTENNKQLGYIPRDIAKMIAPLIVSGKRFACVISKVEKPTAMEILQGKVSVNTVSKFYCSVSISDLEYDK